MAKRASKEERATPPLPSLSNDEIRRYSRQIVLPDLGLEGQRRLKQASVLIIGTGGLGSPAALYLTAAGVGRIGIVDHDTVDVSNLHRQIVHGTSSIGARKVVSARDRMHDVNPLIQVDAYDEPLTSENAVRIASPYDVVIDASDNFPTRYLSNDLCVILEKPNVYGAVLGFEGQVSVFDARKGPCYRCVFPTPPPPGAAPSCTESGVLGVIPGVVGTLQAVETLKLILGLGEPLIGTLLIYDALDQSSNRVSVAKSGECPVCGKKPTITSLIDYDEFCGVPGHGAVPRIVLGEEWEISPRELKEHVDQGDKVRIIDVRETGEWDMVQIPGSECIPLRRLEEQMKELPRDTDIVLVCRVGVRSARALDLLREAGFKRLKNLRGGILAWAKDVDPTMPTY
ncbi:MAG: molybdopterin-synthase adenylyltransferase MoeB [Candidatus Bipolaricaulota bacterium]|nr:molybdopterin-synthase adenylyltransferase MoeB [Candidatus Bipolaricaulota bacterium]